MANNLPVLIPKGKKVLLFDGVCNLCDGFVQFLLKRDKKEKFYFASLQSDIAQQLLARNGITDSGLSTVVLIDGSDIYTHSDVGLRIMKELGGIYGPLYYLTVLPKKFRDRIYNWIAKNRYRFFGKKETCMLPAPEWHRRFLDII